METYYIVWALDRKTGLVTQDRAEAKAFRDAKRKAGVATDMIAYERDPNAAGGNAFLNTGRHHETLTFKEHH